MTWVVTDVKAYRPEGGPFLYGEDEMVPMMIQALGALAATTRDQDLPLGMKENEYGVTWRDAFMLLPCYQVHAQDCLTVPSGTLCPNTDAASFADRGLVLKETFEIGGDVGKAYKAHLVVNGIVSAKYFQGGTRDRGNDFGDSQRSIGTDAFHRGGTPTPTSYDSYQIIVRNEKGEVYQHYFLNSFPEASALESHQVVPLGYEKDIEVPGGGKIEYRIHDPNCRAINNSGPDGEIYAPRNLPNEAGLALPETWHGLPLASWNMVNGAQQPFHAQLIHLRVTKITFSKDL